MQPLALLSVTDKSGLVPFARILSNAGYSLLSTGGTAKHLRDGGLTVNEVSAYTAQREIFGGRVKILHPRIFGPILARPDKDMVELQGMGWAPIDVVVINLYDFEGETSKPDVTLEHAVENIDIGGPSGLRAAAKNFERVTVVCNPADYEWVGRKMQNGGTNRHDRYELMLKVFQHTAAYDYAIASYMAMHPVAP